jgi:hypothetical protein
LHKLVAFDTDRIKDYVFATDALKEIRGASAWLDHLNRQVMPATVRSVDPTSRKVYAHGGAGLFLVEADRAAVAIVDVARAYRRHTGGSASVSGAALDLPVDFDIDRHDSKELFKRLQLGLRMRKDTPPPLRATASIPHIRPCGACSQHPAEHAHVVHNKETFLCDACRLRSRPPRDVWEELVRIGAPAGDLPADFNAVSEFSKPKGYIALVYADGNGMGQQMEALATLTELERFAVGVNAAVYEAACEAISACLAPVNGTVPCAPLLIGGDDLVIVTRADSALDFAIKLAQGFTERAHAKLERSLTLSIAVILAHAKFPFRSMLEIAESTLKFAKREGAKRGLGADRSLINFLTITGSNHLDFKSYYSETLRHQRDPQGAVWLRSLRPYTPDGLASLIAVAREMRDAPRTRLHSLGESIFLEHNQSVLEGLTTLNRWRGNAQAGRRVEQVKILMDLVHSAGSGSTVFPWNGDAQEWRTPLLDLVEIYDFVKEG